MIKKQKQEMNLGMRTVTKVGSSLCFTIPHLVVQNAGVENKDMAEAKYDGNTRTLTYIFKEK